MDYTLENVKDFILEFTELEYQFQLGFFDKSVTEEEWESLVNKLENYYGSRFGYYAIINTTRNESLMNEKDLSNKKKKLRKRKLFMIRKYLKPVFGKGIIDADPDVTFSCFLGANLDMGYEVYASNVSVGIVNGELKIISEREFDSEKRRNEEIIEWMYYKRSNIYTKAITIKKEGTLVETLRILEPEHPTWLADYNS